MLALGVVLVILGVASFVLPMIGYPIPGLDAYQPWVGIIVAAVGLITVLWARAGSVPPAPSSTRTDPRPPRRPPWPQRARSAASQPAASRPDDRAQLRGPVGPAAAIA